MSRKSTSKSKRPNIGDVINGIGKANANRQGTRGYTEKEITGGVLRDIDSPTLVVEGPDDVTIYRWIVDKYFKSIGMQVVPVDGRSQVEKHYTQVMNNRANYPLLPIVFTADQDLDVFSVPPPGYDDIIWTEGYSIENDLYTNGETQLRALLTETEEKLYQAVLDTIIEWFAFEVQEYRSHKPTRIGRKASLKTIVPPGPDKPPTQTRMGASFRKDRVFKKPPRPFSKPNPTIHHEIKCSYPKNLKGKYLFGILVRYLNYEGRKPLYSHVLLWDRVFRDSSSEQWRKRLVNRINASIAKEKKRIKSIGRTKSRHRSGGVYTPRPSSSRGSRGVSVSS